MAATIWSDDKDRRLLELHAAGETQAATAKALGTSVQTVSKHSKRLGVVWTAARIKGRGLVKQAQNVERRADLAAGLRELAEERLEFIKSGAYRDLVKGEYGAEHLADLPVVPSRSLKDEAAALKSITDTIERLKKLDDLNSGGSAVDSWLGFMAAGEVRLKIMAQQQSEDQNTQTGD